MFAVFLTPAYAPFAVAFVVMVGIGLIEVVGLGLGHADLDADVNAEGGGLLDWLGLGAGLPLLIWLTALLGCFTLAGLIVQQVATAALGAPLGGAAASGLAAVLGLLANAPVSRGLARMVPGYESTVVSQADLLRLRGTVLEGVARRGVPARAKVVDVHGQAHYIMVEPHHDSDAITAGETALVVRRHGTTFFVLPDAAPDLRAV